MTDTDTEDDEDDAQPERPPMDSFTVTVTKTFEVDLAPHQTAEMRRTAGEDESDEAVAQTFLKREMGNITPEQKLIGIKADAEGPSDDD